MVFRTLKRTDFKGTPFAVRHEDMNRNKIIKAIIFVVLALNLAANTQAQAPAGKADVTRERAVALWEEAIRAKGGHERLRSIQNFLISSKIDVEAPRGGGMTETERLYALPDKAWVYTLTPHFDVSLDATVINLERNLCLVTLSPARGDVPQLSRCLPTTWQERLIQDPIIYLMETKWVRPVPVRARIEGSGNNKLDVIETEVGKLRVDFYLDRKTRLPIKIVTDHFYGDSRLTHSMGLTIRLDDYAAVDGIQMPRSVMRQPEVGPQTIRRDTEHARYRFNVAYDKTIFDRPVSKKAKSDDWKQRQED